MCSRSEEPIGLAAKVRLAVRVWRCYARVRAGLWRSPLPALARQLGATPARRDGHPPALLSLAVHRALRIGPLRPRCLTSSLVLYRLLREQGDAAELVIGLPPQARDHAAHAWVEIADRVVGPPPGRGRHAPIARYP